MHFQTYKKKKGINLIRDFDRCSRYLVLTILAINTDFNVQSYGLVQGPLGFAHSKQYFVLPDALYSDFYCIYKIYYL